MRIACLIIAYSGAPVLARSLQVLCAAGWDIFVHLDRKADINSYREQLGELGRVCMFVAHPEEVFWGGYSMMRAELKLIEAARAAGTYDKFLLLSDDAFPVLPAQALNEHIATGQDLITAVRQKEASDFFARYHKFFYYDHPATMMRGHGSRPTEIDATFEAAIAEIAVLRRMGKKPLDVYHGSQFWALTAQSIEFVLDKIRTDAHLVKSFEYAALSDELMVQSILGNYLYRKDQKSGPVYADFNKVPGPRVFGSVSELPHRLANEYVFIRKIAPEQGGFVDHMLGNLLSGRNVFGLEVGASTLGVPLVSEDGATHINIRLSAPFEGDNNLWHGVEQFKGIAFRWTREQKVTWHLDHKLPKGTVRFAIPVVMSATPDHLESCSLTFAGVDKPLRYDGRDLVAEFSQQEKGRPWVTLTTPPPVSPKRLWGRPDDRELGIGVMT